MFSPMTEQSDTINKSEVKTPKHVMFEEKSTSIRAKSKPDLPNETLETKQINTLWSR